MRVVAVVPVKLNNERLPGKNVRRLGGKPLICYCLETLLELTEINGVYVYCSSREISPFLPNGVTFLERAARLDSPRSNFTEIFTEFIKTIKSDIYVYAHATAPFVSAKTIRGAISAVLRGEYDSAFCAEKIQDFLWRGGKPLNFDARRLPRSQDLPVIYRETSGVYVFSKNTFRAYRSRVGAKPLIIEVGRREAVDINTEEDFNFAEFMLKCPKSKL